MIEDRELISLLLKLKTAYYIGSPIVEDSEYDKLELEAINRGLDIPVGYSVITDKVELPAYLPSLDKFYADGRGINFTQWIKRQRGNLVIQDKLDGITALYCGNKLYTRGDGRIGRDITHLLPFLFLPNIDDMMVRGELVLPVTVPNSRNVVAGIFNRTKNIDLSMADKVIFVAYEIVDTDEAHLDQMRKLNDIGFDIAYTRFTDNITVSKLAKLAIVRDRNSIYPVDGIVITDNYVHNYVTDRNPSYKVAFKNNDVNEIKVVRVTDVVWSVSQYGRLNPKIIFDPVEIDSAMIGKATCHNARNVVNSKIGVGAIVKIIRSGAVIPKVIEVVKGAEVDLPIGEWDKNGVFLYQKDSEEVKLKRLIYFFTKIDTVSFKEGMIKKLYNGGYTTIKSILSVNVEDLKEIDGIGEKKATIIVDNVKIAYENASLVKMMVASSIFQGLGNRRSAMIVENFDILSTIPSVEEIIKLDGFQEKTALLFTKKIEEFILWLEDLPKKEFKEKTKTIDLTVAMTGGTNVEIKRWIEDNGGTLLNSVPKTKHIDCLIAKDINSTSNKLKVARHKKIPIMTAKDFIKKYIT